MEIFGQVIRAVFPNVTDCTGKSIGRTVFYTGIRAIPVRRVDGVDLGGQEVEGAVSQQYHAIPLLFYL